MSLVTEKEVEACRGHHYPNFCDCHVYLLQKEILRLRKALEWYSQGMPWDDTVGNLSERAVKALSENILNEYD